MTNAEHANEGAVPLPAGSAEAGLQPADARRPERLSLLLIRICRGCVLSAAFLVPLFHLPFTSDPLFAKVTLVEIAALIAGASWLLNVLVTRRLSYRRTPVNIGLLALAVALLASGLLAVSPWAGLWGPDPTGEKVGSVLAFIVLAFVAAAAFRPEDARRLAAAFLVSFGLLGGWVLVSLVAGRSGAALPGWLAVNPVGTVNALALVIASGFMLAAVLLLTQRTSRGRRGLSRPVMWLAAAVSLLTAAALILLGFRMVWFGVAAVMMLAITANFTKFWPAFADPAGGETEGESSPAGAREDRLSLAKAGDDGSAGPEYAMSGAALGVSFLIVAVALFMAVRPPAFVASVFQAPLEVSPSLRATLGIAKGVLKNDPVLGVGPANFSSAFNQFRDTALNTTSFWQTRFIHGFSFASTIPATLGLLGTVALAGLVVLAAAVVGRALWKAEESDPYRWALGAAIGFILIEWFLYASNFTASALMFLSVGALLALASEPRPAEGHGVSWWRSSRRTILMDAPALHFVTSLVVVFAAAFSFVAVWALAAFWAAEIYFNRAADVLNRFGNTDTAMVFLRRASSLNPKESGYYQGQAQVAIAAVNRLVAQASSPAGSGTGSAAGGDVSAEFREVFSAGVNAGTTATALRPDDPQHWFVLGSLYELVIPFIPGADRAAAGAYERGLAVDPSNPVLKLAQGRVLLTGADVASLQASQLQGEARKRLDDTYKELLDRAAEALRKATELKPDYAAAHFLLAQVYLRQQNTAEAIRKTEETARLAPTDIGVAFQLGLLYYRDNNFESAAREFRRAIALNDNYSNARYFLGLIYDRQGDRDGALSQFVKIAALNPENEEIKGIVANLTAGKPALTGIVPPAPAPEVRREAPVREREESPRPPLRGR